MSRARLISNKLDTPARLHAAHALSVADVRLLDIVAANTVSVTLYVHEARLLEAWNQIGAAASLSWAAGMGKLGGVRMNLSQDSSAEQSARRAQLQRVSTVRLKITLMEIPKTISDLDQRIDLL